MKKWLITFIFLFLCTLSSYLAFAQGTDVTELLTNTINVTELLTNTIKFVRNIAIVGAGIIIIIGAYFMITSAGDPTGFERGKKTIIFGILGVVIILLAEALANAILGAIQ